MNLACRFAMISSVCAVFLLTASSQDLPQPELRPTSVAAFKNGLAFVVKQGDAHLNAGIGSIAPIPNVTLGSLWIAPNDAGTSLDELVARRYKVVKPENLTLVEDVLLANAGKVVTIVSDKEYTGEIVGFRSSEEPAADSSPRNSNVAYSNIVPVGAQRPSYEYLLLKSEGKLLALYFRNIVRVILPPDAVLDRPQEEERKELRFKVKGATSRANLTMGYLEHGLGWTPSYLVSLKDDKTAQVTMQAIVVDDAEDLKDTDLFFVVGVPNFAYANLASPMALEQSLSDFMRDAKQTQNLAENGRNVITGQDMIGAVGDIVGGYQSWLDTGAPNAEELQGTPEEDLFLYNRRNVTLARGNRATYNVFSEPVNYEHIYEWDLEDQLRVDASGIALNNTGSSDRAPQDNIWHSLRLKNSTKFPWTSAPAMVISGSRPLSQDALPYTPKGATSNLKLTIAADIRASHEENEVERAKDIQRRHGYNYDLVTVEGTLIIKNYKTKDVQLSISNKIRGTIDSQTDDGKSEKLAEAIAVDNPLTRLRWEVVLKGGEEKTVKYRYKVWLRV
jgi:hypothetical protein